MFKGIVVHSIYTVYHFYKPKQHMEAKSQPVTNMWNQALIYSDMPAKIEATKR